MVVVIRNFAKKLYQYENSNKYKCAIKDFLYTIHNPADLAQ